MSTEFAINIKPPIEPIAPAQPPANPPATPSAEDLAVPAKSTYKTFWGEEAPPQSSTPAASPSAPAQSPTPASTPPGSQERPAQPQTQTAPPEEPLILTTEEIIAQAADAAARRVAQTMQSTSPTAVQQPEPEGFELTPEDREDYEVLLYLEKRNPKYAGKAQEFLDYVKKHYAYIAQWEKDHPDQEFDADAPEHRSWYDANEPQGIDPKDLERAKIDMRVDQAVAARMEPEEKAKKGAKALEEAAPTIVANVQKCLLAMVEQASPELAKLVKDGNNAPVFTDQSIAALEEADPIAKASFDLLSRTELEPMITELEKIAVKDSGVTFNPRQNLTHAKIEVYRLKLERDMTSAPAEQRIVNGREWISEADYARREAAIMNGTGTRAQKEAQLAELDAKHWKLTIDDLEQMIVRDIALKAKLIAQETDKIALKKYGPGRNGAGQNVPAAPAPVAAPAPQPAGGKPNPPSLRGQPELVGSPGTPSGAPKSFGQQVSDSLFSR